MLLVESSKKISKRPPRKKQGKEERSRLFSSRPTGLKSGDFMLQIKGVGRHTALFNAIDCVGVSDHTAGVRDCQELRAAGSQSLRFC